MYVRISSRSYAANKRSSPAKAAPQSMAWGHRVERTAVVGT